jgi:XTP/dITP diphosphohydrolase
MSIKRIVWMATGNYNKYREAQSVLLEFDVDLRIFEMDRIEIQADDPKEVAKFSVKQIEKADTCPIVVEDAGLFIDHYLGFPGVYSSYALRTVGLQGILKLMEGLENRDAKFQSVVAYRYGMKIWTFRGVVKGRISKSIRGTGGFGYDPIFIPEEAEGKTFGEMMTEEKSSISHRAKAFKDLGKWLASSK